MNALTDKTNFGFGFVSLPDCFTEIKVVEVKTKGMERKAGLGHYPLESLTEIEIWKKLLKTYLWLDMWMKCWDEQI